MRRRECWLGRPVEHSMLTRTEPATVVSSGEVPARLPGKGNSARVVEGVGPRPHSHGAQGTRGSRHARPVHVIITMIKWIRTSRL